MANGTACAATVTAAIFALGAAVILTAVAAGVHSVVLTVTLVAVAVFVIGWVGVYLYRGGQ